MKSHQLIIYLLFIGLFFSCKENGPLADDEFAKITVRGKYNPTGLNPMYNLGSTDQELYNLLFQNFADYNSETLEYEALVIEKLPVPEEIIEGPFKGGVSYTMRIRDEAKWEDGQDITAEDYLFALKTIFHPKTNAIRYRAYFDNFADVQINPNDPKELTVSFVQKNIAAMELATSINILPKHIYDKDGILDDVNLETLRDAEKYEALIMNEPQIDSFAVAFNSAEFSRNTVVGSGRYKIKEWLTDQYIAVERVEFHWMEGRNSVNSLAKPDEIVFLLTPDETTAYTQLKSGAIDIFGGLSYQQMSDLKSSEVYSDKFEFHEVQLPRYYFVNINTRRPKLADKSVRKALAYLMDVDTILASYENGLGERLNSPFLSVDSKSTLPDVKFDNVKAEKLLQDAGWIDTNNNGIVDKVLDGKLTELELDFVGTGSALGQVISGVFKQMAIESGVKINVINLDATQYKKRVFSTDFDLMVGAKGMSLAPYDPYAMLHTDNVDPGEGNLSNFGNAESNALIDLIRNTTSLEERDAAYLELEKILAEEQAMIFLYSPVEIIAHKKELEGVISNKKPGYDVQTFHLQ